ncbi:hypothetical protein [Agromyces archimandritae]|uniref:Uncharacterized protein n=1 Tax=Agromyces archimandritae TaxID=2781962 RepID=A0A975FM93_9MICO|nr:hypothetical protein [Agromyces archimandritae]QTX04719.1 hypothetical protein G127AT_00100 [Agromyces archimandritae]
MTDAGYRATPNEDADPIDRAVEPLGDEDAASIAAPDRNRHTTDFRFMIVVLAAILALFLAFGLLIAFSPTGAAISALAVIAAPIATVVVAYYGLTLAVRQVREARTAAATAEARARAAETAVRESDNWAAQMESGLRVAVARLRGANIDTTDVERAAGTPGDFF